MNLPQALGVVKVPYSTSWLLENRECRYWACTSQCWSQRCLGDATLLAVANSTTTSVAFRGRGRGSELGRGRSGGQEMEENLATDAIFPG